MRSSLLAVLLVGCGSHAASAPAAAPDTAPKEERATTSANGPCLATTARDAPAGWAPSGSIVVGMKSGHPSQLTVIDGGKTVTTETPVEERKIRDQIKALTCRANAWLAIPPKDAVNPEKEITFSLYRPSKGDEAADATMLCTLPKEADDPSADESQRATIAAQLYGERLTSVRYRTWFYELDRELGAATTDPDRVTIKQKHGTQLVALLKAGHVPTERCWFTKILATAKP